MTDVDSFRSCYSLMENLLVYSNGVVEHNLSYINSP